MLGPNSEKMKIREGKEIVEMSLRKRGIETESQEQHSKKKRYHYCEVRVPYFVC